MDIHQHHPAVWTRNRAVVSSLKVQVINNLACLHLNLKASQTQVEKIKSAFEIVPFKKHNIPKTPMEMIKPSNP